MNKSLATIRLRLIYHGGPPIHWTGGANQFGLQDKDNSLLAGRVDETGGITFDIDVEVRTHSNGMPVLTGAFTHGPPAERFLYLSWRNVGGDYAQRFKLSLGSITQGQVDHALANGLPLVGKLIIAEQRATKTGVNIGGTRSLVWK